MTTTNEFPGARQGEVFVIPVDAIPADAVPATAENGVHILGHSESGHHHVIASRANVRFFRDISDPLQSWLEVERVGGGDGGVTLEHLRSTDTHAPITIPPGKYRVRNQREASPQGWQRVQD